MLVGGFATMPHNSWIPSIVQFSLCGLVLIIGVVATIRLLNTKDDTEVVKQDETHEAKKDKPSRKQNCDKLAEMYLEYYHQFEKLIDEIAKSRLEDYKKFLKDNEMLAEYKGISKDGLKKAIRNIFIEQGLPQLKHPMLEDKKTGEMKSSVAEMLKLASIIHPNLHGELSKSLKRLDIDGYFILVDRFIIKYPAKQTDTWFANLGTHNTSKRLMMVESWLRDEPTTMLKIINRHKSWWRWLYE